MIDLEANPMCFVLVHNSLAVIVAFVLTQIIRGRYRIAIISLAIALCVSYQLRSLNPLHEFGWRILVHAPLSSIWQAVFYDLSVPRIGSVGLLGLTCSFVSPLVFAFHTAYQWASIRHNRCGKYQVALRSVFVVATLCCIVLGIRNWFDSQAVAVQPLVAMAACIALRPLRVLTFFQNEIAEDNRSAAVRDRLRSKKEVCLKS